jgi:hypothetical protein
MLKTRKHLFAGIMLGIIISLLIYYYITPALLYPPQQKPELPPKEPYYIIIDTETGKTLTYVTSVRVSVGDEYISEDGHRYVISKVEKNRAYAQDFGPVNTERNGSEGLKKDKNK